MSEDYRHFTAYRDSITFSKFVMRASRVLRDPQMWPGNCGCVDSFERVLTAHLRSLENTLQQKGKGALNNRVRHTGVSIAECRELLALCPQLRKVKQRRDVDGRDVWMDRLSSDIARSKSQQEWLDHLKKYISGKRKQRRG